MIRRIFSNLCTPHNFP